MCGILGISNCPNEHIGVEALKKFQYRGPDHTGYELSSGVFMGTNRLAIIDIDERSNQPLTTGDGMVSVVFNGEIFNYRELRELLKSNGYKFYTESDTEVIMVAYLHFGVDLVQHLRGMYAIAIHDRRSQKILLFRDHIGIKPLYYLVNSDQLIFSSELKGITAFKKNIPLSSKAFVLSSASGYIPAPYTMYEGVYKLSAGSVLEYDLNLKVAHHAPLFKYPESNVTTVEELSNLIEEKILSHLVSDVPVGLFFSGGTDSSLIAAVLNKHNINLRSYAIEMDNKRVDSHFTEKISDYLNLRVHKEHFGQKQFNESLEEIRLLLDEPTHDSSTLALYHLAKSAKKDVKVVLSGEGADEFFYGYPRHHVLANSSNHPISRADFFDILYNQNYIRKGKRRIAQLFYEYNNDLYGYYLSTTANSWSSLGWKDWRKIFSDYDINSLSIDSKFYLENDLLRKNDLATSYASIEGRVPFLDVDIIASASNFVERFKNGTISKPVLKEVLCQYLPDELVYRRKSGLGLPVRSLFKNSTRMQSDFSEAINCLSSYDAIKDFVPRAPAEKLIHFEPYYSFYLTSYYYALLNTSENE